MSYDDLDLLIINQIRLQRKVKGLLNNEDSDIVKVVENLRDLSENTNDLTTELSGGPVSSGSSLNTSDYDFYVDLVDSSDVLKEGLYIYYKGKPTNTVGEQWINSLSKDLKLFYIVQKSTDTIIKEVHKRLLDMCEKKNETLSNDFVEFLQFMLSIRNLNFDEEAQARLFFPTNMRFERSEMKPTQDVMSGDVVQVLCPGILELKLKALVVVE
tara:strand:- start:1935 stop:2573 length:639 start_codon:yes stop_codon:yes gene_type:complete